jgi:hypothetical protein
MAPLGCQSSWLPWGTRAAQEVYRALLVPTQQPGLWPKLVEGDRGGAGPFQAPQGMKRSHQSAAASPRPGAPPLKVRNVSQTLAELRVPGPALHPWWGWGVRGLGEWPPSYQAQSSCHPCFWG